VSFCCDVRFFWLIPTILTHPAFCSVRLIGSGLDWRRFYLVELVRQLHLQSVSLLTDLELQTKVPRNCKDTARNIIVFNSLSVFVFACFAVIDDPMTFKKREQHNQR